MPHGTADELRSNDRRVVQTNNYLRIIEDVAGADGVIRHWMVQKFPIRGFNNQVWVAGTAADVTEWLAAEKSLRRAKKLS